MSYEKLKFLLTEAIELNKTGNFENAEQRTKDLLVKLDSADKSIEKEALTELDTLRCSAFIELSISQWRRGDFQSALIYALNSLDLEDKITNLELKAKALGNIGVVYRTLSDYAQSLSYYQRALVIYEEIGNNAGIATNLGNMGNVYWGLSDYAKALDYYQKALAIAEEAGNNNGIATNLGNIGTVYHYLSDHTQALTYYQKALAINKELGNKDGMANNLGNIGNVHQNISDYAQALTYYQKAIAINEEIGSKTGIAVNLGNIGIVYQNISNYPQALSYYQKALAINEEISNKNGIARNLGNIGQQYAMKEFDGYNPDITEEYLLRAIDIFEEIGEKINLYEIYLSLAALYEKQERWKESAIQFKKYHSLKEEVQNEEATKQAQLMENRRKMEEAERDRQVKLARFQEQEKILLNILPAQIAERILEGEKRIANLHEHVSVFFSDIVGFTKLSQTVTPDELLTMLNEIFSEFDRIARKHGLEKIKTIGDAYMAVAGVPMDQEDHAERAAGFALDVIEYMKEYRKKSNSDLQIRVGLHSGKAIAGVIGENKFAYDLWGDSVNTASRMESHGEAGKIHVSDDFKNALTKSSLHFTERGEMEVKGKGMMKTYFLEKSN
jgi:class 3 adenylate cyclase